MTILEYHKQFKLFLDKVSSEQLPEFTSKQIDVFLHEAEVRIVKQAYGQNNIYKKGYQEIQKRTDDLNTLVKTAYLKPKPIEIEIGEDMIPDVGLGQLQPPESSDGVYTFKLDKMYLSEQLASFTEDYMFFIKGMVKVRPSYMSVVPDVYTGISLIPQDKYTEVIKDPFNKSRMSSPVAFFEDNSIKIDTAKDSFFPSLLKVTYIKYPKKVNLATLVSSELPEQKQLEALQLAVRIALGAVESPRIEEQNNQLSSLE